MQSRSHHRGWFGWLFVAALLAVGAATLPALAAPIPHGPNALTHAKYNQLILKCNEKTLIGAYDKVGIHNPKWDTQARAFLEQIAAYFSHIPGHKSAATLEAAAKKLMEEGCDDPLIAYCRVAMYEDHPHKKWHMKQTILLLQKSLKGLIARHYPPLRCFAAAQRLHNNLKDNYYDKSLKPVWQYSHDKLVEYFKKTLEVPVHGTIERRFHFKMVRDQINVWKESDSKLKYPYQWSRKKSTHIDPWYVGMIGGIYHINAAWDARGSKLAGQVTQKGWKGFGDHIKAARKALASAWEYDKNAPEAPTQMIVVAMGVGNATDVRRWFDRAVAAQMDYGEAYSNYIYAMQPQWCGSFPELYQFALECYHTQRYDTWVPYKLLTTLRDMRDDWANPDGYGSIAWWKRPGVYTNVADMLQHYIKYIHSAHSGQVRDLRTEWLAFAAMTEHWADARKQLDLLGDKPNWSEMKKGGRGGTYRLDYNRVKGEVYANTGPTGTDVQKATALARAGQMRQSLAIYKKLLDKPIKKPYVKRFLEDRAQALQWRIPFDMNVPIALKADANLTGWQPLYIPKMWTAQADGSLIFAPQANHDGANGIYCRTNFGRYWELSGDITRMNAAAMAKGSVGVFLGNTANWDAVALLFDPKKKELLVGKFGCDCAKHVPFADANAKHIHLRLRMENDVATVWVNGKKLVDHWEIENWPTNLYPHISLGADHLGKGAKLRFSHFVIRHYDPNQKRSPVLLN